MVPHGDLKEVAEILDVANKTVMVLRVNLRYLSKYKTQCDLIAVVVKGLELRRIAQEIN